MKNKILQLLLNVISNKKLVKQIRKILHPDGIACLQCGSRQLKRISSKYKYPREYHCTKCDKYRTENTGTLLENSKLSIDTVFVLLVLISFGLPVLCIGFCLNISYKTAYKWYWRVLKNLQKVDDKPVLSGIVESDEVYITSGEKSTKQTERLARNRGLKSRGRGTMAKDRPPILGLVDRVSKKIRLFVCETVKKDVINPLIVSSVEKGSEINTDGYEIYNDLEKMGYTHKTVIHSSGCYAEDWDGDGFYEVHCNSVEGLWSLLRHFLRGFRGINKHKLSHYIRLFEYLYNARVEERSPEQMIREMLMIQA